MKKAPMKKTRRRPANRRKATFDWNWKPLAFLGASITREDRELFLYVSPCTSQRWIVLAFEGPVTGDARAILSDHGHELVGDYATLTKAQRAAESFGKSWLRRSTVAPCGCDEVRQ